jgi:malate permease and related proteins
MEIVITLLLKLIGLYIAIAMGWFAVKKYQLDREGVSRVLFYMIVPLVFLHGIAKMDLSGEILLLPLLTFVLACAIVWIMDSTVCRYWHDNTRNILAFTSGNGNIGYFGLPIAILLFDTQTVAIYMVMILGLMLYESTYGYYILSKGQFSRREAIVKMLSQPMLHGSLIGLGLSLLNTPTPAFLEEFFLSVRGTYSILGMMMVGMGLAGLPHFKLDWAFMAASFGVKFIIWPLAMFGCIWIDTHFLHWLTPDTHKAMIMFSIVPLAVNSVILATLFNAQPEKIAAAVFASTAFALIYVPVMVTLFIL